MNTLTRSHVLGKTKMQMKGMNLVLRLSVLLLFTFTVNASYVRLPSGDGACDGFPSSIEWFRTGRDFCHKDVQTSGGVYWECQGGAATKYLCESPSCDGECKEVPVSAPCPSAGITCAPTFDLSHEHLTSTTVYYKNSQCAGEGTDVLKIHQKSECEGGSSSSSCIEEDDDRSFREFCGSDFTPELVENDEEFRIVDQFASSATQRAQLVLVGFVVLDLLLCYVMVH